jgi:hypothetical protein
MITCYYYLRIRAPARCSLVGTGSSGSSPRGMWEHTLPDPTPPHATAGLLVVIELQAILSVWGKTAEPAVWSCPGGSSPAQLDCQRPKTPRAAGSRSIAIVTVAPEPQTCTQLRKSRHRQRAPLQDGVAPPPLCWQTSVTHCQPCSGSLDAR